MASNTERAKAIIDLDGKQAGQELDMLKTKAKQLKEELAKAKAVNDLKSYKDLEKQLKSNETAQKSFTKAVFDTNNVLKNLSGSTLRDLQRAQRELSKEISNSARATIEEKNALAAKQNQLKQVKSEIDKVTGSMKQQQTSGQGWADMFKNVYFQVAAVTTAIGAFASKAYSAYEEQEVANRRLLFALRGNKVAYFELTKQAGELQKKLGVPDETIMQIQMLAAETGKSTDEIKKITQASIELSVATGEDLQSSYMKLNATYTGTAGRLNRLDDDFGKLTKSQLEHGAAIDLVLKKYSGLAEQSVSPVKALSVAWAEFMESLGSSGGKLSGTITFFTNWVYLMAEGLKSIKLIKSEVAADNTGQDIQKGMESIDIMKKSMIKNGISANKADQMAYNAYLQQQKNYLGDLTQQMAELNKEKDKSSLKEKIAWTNEVLNLQARKRAVQAEIDGVKQARAPKSDDLELTKKKVKEVEKEITELDKLTNRISETKKQIELLALANQPIPNSLIHQLTADQAKLKEVENTVKGIADGLAKIGLKTITGIPTNKFEGVPDKLKPQAMPDMASPGATTGFALFGQNLKEQLKDPAQLKEAALTAAQTTETAIFDIVRNNQQAQFDHKMTLLDKQKEAELSNKNLTETQKAMVEAKYEAKAKKLKQDQFRKQKSADVIQSLINTALAVTKVLDNPVQAILTALAGAAQTAVIAAQPVPEFSTGGRTSQGADHQPAGIVHANEYVIPAWERRLPHVMAMENVIESIRQRGYASGGPVSQTSTGNSISQPGDGAGGEAFITAITRFSNTVDQLQKDGLYAKLVYQDFKLFENKVTQANTLTN